MLRRGQVQTGLAGQTYRVNENRRRPSSWPASLLPTMLLAALMVGGAAAATNSSDDAPVLDMTVTTSK
jgi:hypothetical protein